MVRDKLLGIVLGGRRHFPIPSQTAHHSRNEALTLPIKWPFIDLLKASNRYYVFVIDYAILTIGDVLKAPNIVSSSLSIVSFLFNGNALINQKGFKRLGTLNVLILGG